MDEIDLRLGVVMGTAAQARPGDLVLALPPAAAHPMGCRCCGGRDPLAIALSGAYVARGRGSGPWFDRVLLDAAPETVARVAAVLEADPVMQARFRLDPAV